MLIGIMEQDTGFEPALSVWKTDVQTSYTSPAIINVRYAVRVSIPRLQIKSLVLSQLSSRRVVGRPGLEPGIHG